MFKMEKSNEEDEVQFIEERVRPSTRSSNDVGQRTQIPTIPSPEREREHQQQHESDALPCFDTNASLKICFLRDQVNELQKSNASLTTQLRSEHVSSNQLSSQLTNVKMKLQQVQQEKVSLQIEHERALTTSKRETNEAQSEARIWKGRYVEMNEQHNSLKDNLNEQRKELENLNEKRYNQTVFENEIKYEAIILELKKEKQELRSTNIEQSTTILSNSIQLAKLSTDLQQAERDIKIKADEMAKTEDKLIKANGEIRRLEIALEEKERFSKNGKRGNLGCGGGFGEGSKKKRNNTIPVSSHSNDDNQTRTSEDNQMNAMDSIEGADSQPQNDDDDLTHISSSSVNRNPFLQ